MWLPFLPGCCVEWAIMKLWWWNVFWRVSEWLWKAPFTSCTNEWSSLCHQSKIDNSSDISYSIFWILRVVGFPWDTNLSASLLLHLQRACWKIRGRAGGEWRKRKERLGVGKKRKMTQRSFFLFWLHQQWVSHFRAWQMELCCSATINDAVSLPLHPSRVIEVGFKTKIKMLLLFMNTRTCDLFQVRIFEGSELGGDRWGEEK